MTYRIVRKFERRTDMVIASGLDHEAATEHVALTESDGHLTEAGRRLERAFGNWYDKIEPEVAG
jgi:hypothetical protein